ncbi:M23 family metallopeptidase [Sinorhizobium psoraleae]|uniref:M23 family metallopeptidase n=1 Tax=Sinorhizobium psoraleae TaxID=520838 RepID=A0ABT4KLE1_9HYPH|nr:M23 family metallopeptidase [Sinorhizobium psoraleae]MCZ4092777.1 M23 family metallopeptidase [Sinorhizobium psoraleae]
MSVRPANRAFGKSTRSHVLILASGDKVRHMTVRPWMAALVTSVVGVFGIGYLAATTYLVLRDDLIGGTIARQARMQHEYEDRITALRAQVDRVTSRQLLDQQVVEEKVEKLLQQQSALWSRRDRLGALARSADASDDLGADVPPVVEPLAYEKPADAHGGVEAIEEIMGMSGEANATPMRLAALAYAPVLPESRDKETVSDRADRIFSKVTLSLKDVERDHMVRMERLRSDAARASEAIRTIVERTGVALPAGTTAASASGIDRTAIGGPFVEPQNDEPFGKSLAALDSALLELERTREAARKLPLAHPAPASDITSNFGNRLDPFLGRLALHAGIDFRASTGTRIRTAAAGTVTVAGPTGGYGNMVEIDHGNGVVTRYAHLSVILVNVGDHVRADDVIAKSGSTGRSTGPHLHYEVRLNDQAVDPMRFLSAGTKLAGYLN